MRPAPTTDQPGPLVQWPQYEKPVKADSPSSSTSNLTPSQNTNLEDSDAFSPPSRSVSEPNQHPVHRSDTHSITNLRVTNSNRPTTRPTYHRRQSPTMGNSNRSRNGSTPGGVFSRLSTKVFAGGRSNTSTDMHKKTESPRNLRRFSLQPEHLMKNRERVGASGLRRSWLFDKRMMPIVLLDDPSSDRFSAGSLFFTLPVELQLQIITKLIYSDIISLRKTCRSFNNLIVSNEHEIARRQLQDFVEPRYLSLYPPDSPTKPSFAYLSKLATKSIAASELSRALVTQLYDDFQDKYFEPHAPEAKPLIIRYMTERLRFSIMIIQHFLDQFAERKLKYDKHNGYPSKADDMQLQEAIMEKYYTSEQLIEASDFYRLTLYLLWQNVSMSRTREPVKRVWALLTDTIPDVQDLTKFMLVGGISELRNIYRKDKRSSRRKAIAQFAAKYKTEQARGSTFGSALMPRVTTPPECIRRFSTLSISPNIFHLWIHPAQHVLFRQELIESLNSFRCIDEIVNHLLEGWEQWAYAGNGDESGAEDEDAVSPAAQSSVVAAAS